MKNIPSIYRTLRGHSITICGPYGHKNNNNGATPMRHNNNNIKNTWPQQ